MDPQVEQALYDGMQHESDRRGPPEGFSELPVIPAGRYTDPAFLALEQEHLWQGSWLYALHADELPKPGSFRLWDRTGSPIVIVRGQDDEIGLGDAKDVAEEDCREASGVRRRLRDEDHTKAEHADEEQTDAGVL